MRSVRSQKQLATPRRTLRRTTLQTSLSRAMSVDRGDPAAFPFASAWCNEATTWK